MQLHCLQWTSVSMLQCMHPQVQGHTPGGTVSAMWVSSPTLVYRPASSWVGAHCRTPAIKRHMLVWIVFSRLHQTQAVLFWDTLSDSETYCVTLQSHCASMWLFNIKVFSFETHCIQAKQSCISDHLWTRISKLATVKNAMYLASLKLVKQITIEGAEDYALTTKSPRCSLNVFDNKILRLCRPASSMSQSVADVLCCHTSKLSGTDDLSLR